MSKINKVVTGNTLTVQFPDGRQLSINVDSIPANLIPQLVMHGLSQKVGDSYAGALNAQDAYERAEAVIDGLVAGNWNSGRTGMSGDLVEAMMAEFGRTREECVAVLAKKDKDQRAALKKQPAIVARLALITAKRMSEKAAIATPIDLGALFG